MSRHYILDENRNAVEVEDCLDWARWLEEADELRRVGDDAAAGSRVSTVFLGLNHQWCEGGRPLIFETMVFGGPLDGEQQRYSTWQEAEAGHKAMLQRVSDTQGEED